MKAKKKYEYELTIGRYKQSYCDGKTPMETRVVAVESLVPFWNLQGEESTKMDMIQPKFWQKKIDAVAYPMDVFEPDAVKGKVGIYTGSFVDAAVEASGKTLMSALIVTMAPTEFSAMPVFCLQKQLVDEVVSWGEHAKIIVKPIRVEGAEETESPPQASISQATKNDPSASLACQSKANDEQMRGDHQNVKEHPLQAESTKHVSNDAGASDKHGTKRKLYSEVATGSAVKKGPSHVSGEASSDGVSTRSQRREPRTQTSSGVRTSEGGERSDENSEDEDSQSSEDEVEVLFDGDDDDFGATAGGAQAKSNKKEKGMFHAALKAVTNTLGLTHDVDMFATSSGWYGKENFRSYRKAMDDLRRMEPYGDVAKSVVKTMPQFLQRTGGNIIVKLAFACQLWTTVACPKEELLDNILIILGNFDFVKMKPDLEGKQFRNIDEKPNTIFGHFFALAMTEPALQQTRRNSKLWGNICWLWLRCGLLKSPIDWKSWTRLRSIVGSNFWRQAKGPLLQVFQQTRYHTLALFLQATVKDVNTAILELKKSNSPLRVDVAAAELFKHFGTSIAAKKACNEHSLQGEWCLLFAVLLRCSFVNHNTMEVRGNVLGFCVSQSSFASTGGFGQYDSIVKGLARVSDRERHQLGRSAGFHLRKSVRADLQMKVGGPSARDVRLLLQYSWCSVHLSDRWAIEGIFDYVRVSFGSRNTNFQEKLLLFDAVRSLVGGERLAKSRFVAVLHESLGLHTRQHILQQTCSALEACENLFGDAAQDFVSHISSLIVGWVSDDSIITNQLPNFRGALFAAQSFGTNSFARRLAADLVQALLYACDSMYSTSLVFLGILQTDDEASMQLASALFCDSFSKWQPRSFERATVNESSKAWELVFQCFESGEQWQDRAQESQASMSDCKRRLGNLFENWVCDFQTGQITFACLETGLAASKLETWSLVARQFDLQLPSVEDIEKAMEEAEALVESIKLALVAPAEWGRSLRDLLTAYDCRSENDRSLAVLFDSYPIFVGAQPVKSTESFICEHSLFCRPVKLLRSDQKEARQFHSDCMEALSACAYFLKHPSILFQEGFSIVSKGECNGVHELRRCVEQTNETLMGLFSLEASFGSIQKACLALEGRGVQVDHELSILADCKVLQLHPELCDRFRLSSLVCRTCEPLADLLGFCEQFKFSAIQRDDDFLGMKEVIDKIVGQKQIGDPISQCQRLYKLLFLEDKSVSVADENLREIEGLLPLLKLFTCLRRHHEVWNLAQEKHWFGKEGLSTFLKALDHLNNLHLDSYNTTVLEVMEPIMRVVSIVGGLKMTPNVNTLLKSLLSNQHIQTFLLHGRYQDFQQIQLNLGQVRRWFCEDGSENEITGFYRDFRAVTRGRYFISSGENGLETGLHLEYKDKESSATMTCGQIQSLIAQLSNIQHDDNNIAEAIDSFMEQHTIIEAAASTVLKMHQSGYRNAAVEHFECSVGELDEAKTLLEKCKQRLHECEIWLRETRRCYSLSLLFWDDELRELHTFLCEDNDEGLGTAVYMLSRLLPRPNISQDDMESTAEIVSRLCSRPRQAGSDSWLLEVSRFVEEVHKAMGNPRSHGIDGATREVVVHNVTCEATFKDELVLTVLQRIYKDRLPMDFEILDGLSPSFEERLPVFLERAKHFPSCIFTVLNADKVKKKEHLAVIRSFLTSKVIVSGNIRFHCVQCEPALPLASPFYQSRGWANESRDRMTPMENTNWNACIVGPNSFVNEATVVVSNDYCAGKTRFIRGEQQRLVENGPAGMVESGTIAVHEKSTADALISAVTSKFQNEDTHKVLHMSVVSVPKEDDEARRAWFQQLNMFFLELLVLRVLHNSNSQKSFYVGRGKWSLFVELPSDEVSRENCQMWLQANIPLLGFVGRVQTPIDLFHIDKKTRRVCTYLRADDDGSINDRFDPETRKQIVFLLDQSESMEYEVAENKSQLSAATDYALQIFDTHIQLNDLFGVILFNHEHKTVVPIQAVQNDVHKAQLRTALDGARGDIPLRGGTRMFSALSSTIDAIESGPPIETWIVCLTDGDSDRTDTEDRLRQQLLRSRNNLHVVVMGVNLFPYYEDKMRLLCRKYCETNRRRTKGFYVGSDSTVESMSEAFRRVAKALPVSQTFDLHGEPDDEECRALIQKYAPGAMNMQRLNFWIRFLHRRISILDMNDSFNFNETTENLGSSLLSLMFAEVQRMLETNQERDWSERNFSQLIYDFADPENPQFRLLCTSPKMLSTELKRQYEDLGLPGFFVPSEEDLAKRTTLDRLISQAMQIPLEGRAGEERLRCIDNGFILTLDFAIKLLCIHERVSSGVPCIMEGESGVSKTELSKQYCNLMNSARSAEACRNTLASLAAIEDEAVSEGFPSGNGSTPRDRLEDALKDSQGIRAEQTDLSVWVHERLKASCVERSPICKGLPEVFADDKTAKSVIEMLQWFSSTELERTFFEVNIHSSLSESAIVGHFAPIRALARKLSDVSIVVFLDEVNTSSILGIFKEIICDHSLQGEMLEPNIIVIAACNPARRNLMIEAENARELDLGRSWASGHYQVSRLPPPMEGIKWCFGALKKNQERDFIFRRLKSFGGIPFSLQRVMTEIISFSQEAMREFAAKDIEVSLRRLGKYSDDQIREEAQVRSKSVVSLRDIQRLFALYTFFLRDFPLTVELTTAKTERSSMLLSVAIVYLLRLDSGSREDYIRRLQSLPGEKHEMFHLQDVLDEALEQIMKSMTIPEGIASTRGLKETIFMTLVCNLSGTPLAIVGPPGCSKTLSVNLVGDNVLGEESLSPQCRKLPRLSFFHYQCSRGSTSKEVEAVFGKATRRQKMVDPRTNICVVFLDEAGLAEEKMESLKVLHYFLEGQMSSRKGGVGFVTISNHVLDAAKSNRCAMLFREEPGDEEMLTMTNGVLYGCRSDGSLKIHNVEVDGRLADSSEFAMSLCRSYAGLRKNLPDKLKLDTFFGLRDFIYFLKSLRSQSFIKGLKMVLTLRHLLTSIERNYNGLELEQWKLVAVEVLRHLVIKSESALSDFIHRQARCPMRVLHDALSSEEAPLGLASRPRFTLIVDCSEDDSIMRILHAAGLMDVSKKTLFKLSHMPEEKENEQLRVISGVKYSAMQGHTVLLSETNDIDESFYDLENQNFRKIESIDGSVTLFANIAMGGVSRRCPVHPSFNCIVQVRASNLDETPSPFLARFQKFRLSVSDVLSSGWSSLGKIEPVLQKARQRAAFIVGLLGEGGLIGTKNQTLDSVFVGILPTWTFTNPQQTERPPLVFDPRNTSFMGCMATFISHVATMRSAQDRVAMVVEKAAECLPSDEKNILQQMMDCDNEGGIQEIQSALSWLLINDAKELTPTQKVCTEVIQMVFTEYVVSTMLRIATPEAVYAQRHGLPKYLVDEYFSREHFSLKQFLAGALTSDESQLLIVHTRTDAQIHMIPSFNSESDHGDRNTVKSLVCEDLNVIIEHLDSLRSAASFRKALADFVNGTYRVFLLLVDMSKRDAVENVNYARMFTEQCSLAGKTALLLLHYPTSSCGSCPYYPALFLGNWQHTFLDGVGQSGPSLALAESIRLACGGMHCGDRRKPANEICGALSKMMPTVVSHLACRKFLYKEQEGGVSSFQARWNFLKDVLSIDLGDGNVSDILCQKFAAFWLDQGLETTVRMACLRLQRGTTQLSVSVAVLSTLLEAFDKFWAWSMTSMNTWRGLDLLQLGGTEEVALFGTILKNIPVPPFEELMLLQERCALVRPMPSAMDSQTVFPFFYDTSSYIEELLDLAAEEIVENGGGKDSTISQRTLLISSMDILRSPASGPKQPSARKGVVSDVIELVQSSDKLFEQYLRQFVAWKAAVTTNPYIMKWIVDSVAKLGWGGNIVAVHCVVRCCHIEFMKLASWSTLAHGISGGLPSSPATSTEGEIKDLSHWPFRLLLEALQSLEGAIPEGAVDRNAWCSKFSTLLHHCSVVTNDIDHNTVCRIRIVCLFNALFQLPTPHPQVEAAAIGSFWGGQEVDAKIPSLEMLFGLVEGKQHLEEAILWQFFSPFAMSCMKAFHTQDFNFLLEALEEGRLDGHSHQWKVSLLLRACMYFGEQDENPTTHHQVLELPMAALGLLNAKLSVTCQVQATFSENGTRISFPHFIPRWLRADDGAADNSDDAQSSAFLSSYNHTFDGTLAAVSYDMLAGRLLRQSFDLSSAELLQMMLADINEEEQMTQKDHMRFARMRANQSRSESMVGSSLAAMIADVRILCFVAGLARDLATGPGGGSALCEQPFDEICKPLLQQIMGIPTARFVDFFFSQVLRHRGDGRLIELLGDGGPLHGLPWCQSMCQGIPTMVYSQQNALRNAEAAFQEGIEDEERMTRDLKLCPHADCSRPFSVLERNCGQFTCGRDYHDAIGRDGRYGCGRPFSVDTAPNYRVNEQRLAPLRRDVEAQRQHLAASQRGETSWRVAREFEVPLFLFFVETPPSGASIVPSISMLGTCADHDAASRVVRVALQGAKLVDSLALLPDLIELYVWLHSVFGQVMSKEEALERAMGDIMKEERLLRRFDRAHARHMVALWGRIVVGTNRLLVEMEHKVAWNCQLIDIPFRVIERAALFSLLSEGSDPLDGGCDFLFLIISEIITKYNSYVQHLSELKQPTDPLSDDSDRCVHPKFLMAGSGGAAAINRSTAMTDFELETLIDSCWNTARCEFDTEILLRSLVLARSHYQPPPRILSPLQHLREEFIFRMDRAPDRTRQDSYVDVFKGMDGTFFAREQDLQLVREVEEELQTAIGLLNPDKSIRQSLCAEFHNEVDSHQKLTGLLGGMRNLLELISTESIHGFERLGEALNGLNWKACQQDSLGPANEIGFPEINASNMALLLALNKRQTAELVRYLGFQLASEGYLYSEMPVFMTAPLRESTVQELILALDDFCEAKGPQHALSRLKEFIRGVLIHYEPLIKEAANLRDQPLKTYLEANNFCGSEDSIFELLPREIGLQNYVSLRQHLQQAELSFAYKCSASTTEVENNVASASSFSCTGMSAGQCWLWQPEGAAGVDPVPTRKSSGGLWFLDCPTIDKTSGNLSRASKEAPTEVRNEASASRIQAWWRRLKSRCQSVDMNMDMDPADDEFYDTLTDMMDEMEEEEEEEFFDYDEVEIPLDTDAHSMTESGTLPMVIDNPPEDPTSEPSNTSLQQWLEENKLSQTVYDALIELGASSVDDVKMVVAEPELLDTFKKLDQVKLRKAVDRLVAK